MHFGGEHRGWIKRHRRLVIVVGIVVGVAGFIHFVVPQLSGLSGTLKRLAHADPWWIAAGVAFEALSLGGYILLFRTVFSTEDSKIGWRESYQINMAGTVASKLLATAGAGGVALSVWALRASGLEPREIARRMITFELMLYTVFALALLIGGIGLDAGVFPGRAPWALTVIPAIVAGGAILAALSLRALPADLEKRLVESSESPGRARRLLSRLAAAPSALRDATELALELIRERNVGTLGAVAYWGFDIATLWACLHAFGSPPPPAALVMAYFIGQLGNVLPLPGGVGGVEGGTIGALLAFGSPGGLAVLGVLAYRAISFWLPTLPGGIAYLRLRRTVLRWRAT